MFKNWFKTVWQNIRDHFNHLSFYPNLILYIFLLTFEPLPSIAQVKIVKPDSFLDSKPFIGWAKCHAFPLENCDSVTSSADLQPLKKIIGNAHVVALGEPAHGLHELLAFRNRMFRFLVENCGFTTIILEA